MIYLTGDCHGNYSRLNMKNFPEQKQLTRNDTVIVLGDFGLWQDDKEERWWLNWLADKSFTLAFVDGNHENFDRLYSDEFPVVDFHGAKAHQIRENIFHLMRGEIMELEHRKFFIFGGAASHDIQDGVLDPADYRSPNELSRHYRLLRRQDKMVRILHQSWWPLEMPDQQEMDHGLDSLVRHDFKVDYVLSHCLPGSIARLLREPADTASDEMHQDYDALEQYFQELLNIHHLRMKKWFSGHYHLDTRIGNTFQVLYQTIIPLELTESPAEKPF